MGAAPATMVLLRAALNREAVLLGGTGKGCADEGGAGEGATR